MDQLKMSRKGLILSAFLSAAAFGYYVLFVRNRKSSEVCCLWKELLATSRRRRLKWSKTKNKTAEQFIEAAKEDIAKHPPDMQLYRNLIAVNHAQLLTSMVVSGNPESVIKAAVTIGNLAAFTQNNATLAEGGCICALKDVLLDLMTQQQQQQCSPEVLSGVVNAISNLAMNTASQQLLEDCLPALLDLTRCEEEGVQLAALRALTNFSVFPDHHPPYTQIVQTLYQRLDNGTEVLRLQTLKLLSNLSSNEEIVPHLLAAQAPRTTFPLLAPPTPDEFLLRWTTILSNVIAVSKAAGLTAASLPCQGKAPSPETMFTALFGLTGSQKLKTAAFNLCRHGNADVSHQAMRMYSSLQ